MIDPNKATKIKVWHLLLVIALVSIGLGLFVTERTAVMTVVVIEAVLLLALAAIYASDFWRWCRRRKH